MQNLTPRQIVEELDRYIVGQAEAKRAVAIAIRNRWRRQRLTEEMRKEVTPKNIIMIGPTGVGKTEIARRLAMLIQAPFCKVEATKYTEVGYHGRDVESVVRDLVESAFRMVRDVERERVTEEARERANRRILDLLLPDSVEGDPQTADKEPLSPSDSDAGVDEEQRVRTEKRKRTRERMRQKLDAGELEDRIVHLRVEHKHVPVQIFSNIGMEQMDVDLQQMFDRIAPREARSREMTVCEARSVLLEQEIEQLIDREAAAEKAVRLAEKSGVVFVDEIDKICGPTATHGPDVSRQGVQRDLLPIVEGTTVQTRYGPVRTDHVLFIAAGAFHLSSPSDLMPELQGRFPIRVELTALGRNDFVRILSEPRNAMIRQYTELLATEDVHVSFGNDAIETIAEIADQVNKSTQNIGARRLQTIMEKLLEEPSFDAPDTPSRELHINTAYVREKLSRFSENVDVSRYIL